MPDLLSGNEPRGRFTADGAFAVIDIGSNSVRLVVYEREARAPTALFNEKVLAGLGRGLAETGRLCDENVKRALAALHRFRAICDHIGVGKIAILATAAAREAENGPEFIAHVEEICREQVKILSGADEAYYSAMGVISGFWQPDGLVGDLGGGSLELVDLKNAQLGEGHTFPLGGIRLQEASRRNLQEAMHIASDSLATADWLTGAEGRKFYAIGGTWRSLGRLHLFQERYPLHVMHEYTIPAEVALEFCERVARGEITDQPKIGVVSKARRSLLPYGAVVMREVIHRSKVDQVVFSSLGVREGLLYSILSPQRQQKDPLLTASRELGLLRARCPAYSDELAQWSGKALSDLGIVENPQEERLRLAACNLADIGWRAHPDYRGKQSLNVISNMGFVGVDHAGRAYLALTVFYRHEGLIDDAVSPKIRSLCSPRLMQLARALGAVMRLASLISASISGMLPRTRLEVSSSAIILHLPEDVAAIDGERLRKRLNQLGKLFSRTVELRIED
ncbi:exopolyphosphatase [Polycladidibacter hongkongensis]|uniref:exopolyphosphatase n=1 Tax=Polycladidibacter hongkongensis TaxID=1647556 RepID=UPI00082A4BE2|nr:exopolyphosphatase [Pseudovibrio hongkongensis]